MPKQRVHGEYFRPVSMGGRKSCPSCKSKLHGEHIWSWGEYVYGKWRTVDYFCKLCYNKRVKLQLLEHRAECGCTFELRPYQCDLPDWLNLETSNGHAVQC